MRLISPIVLILLITVNAFAAIPIYCPNCREHIYDYQKNKIELYDKLYAEDFKPSKDSIKQPEEPDEMTCPLCGKYFDGWNYYSYHNKCIIRNIINSIVLLTKDSKGFKWIPYDIADTPYSRE
jgi:hypothetical protein